MIINEFLKMYFEYWEIYNNKEKANAIIGFIIFLPIIIILELGFIPYYILEYIICSIIKFINEVKGENK